MHERKALGDGRWVALLLLVRKCVQSCEVYDISYVVVCKNNEVEDVNGTDCKCTTCSNISRPYDRSTWFVYLQLVSNERVHFRLVDLVCRALDGSQPGYLDALDLLCVLS